MAASRQLHVLKNRVYDAALVIQCSVRQFGLDLTMLSNQVLAADVSVCLLCCVCSFVVTWQSKRCNVVSVVRFALPQLGEFSVK